MDYKNISENRQEGFTQISNLIIRKLLLSSNEFRVLCFLHSFDLPDTESGKKKGYVYPAIITIRNCTRLSNDAIMASLHVLEAAELIEIRKRPRKKRDGKPSNLKRNEYKLNKINPADIQEINTSLLTARTEYRRLHSAQRNVITSNDIPSNRTSDIPPCVFR